MQTAYKRFTFIFTVVLASLLTACGSDEAAPKGPAGPLNISVFSVEKQSTTLYSDYPARIQGEQDIEIRPKIDGYVDAVLVEEGQVVRKGQVLFRISNPQYEQAARNAEAAVELAETEVENAQLQWNKAKPLVEKGIVSAYELESARLVLKAKKAALLQARANLANATNNVGYTTIKSPFEGVVGILNYKLGSYVSSNTALPLTTISSIGKVYAYFSLSEKEQLHFFRNTAGKTMTEKITQLPEVTFLLSDGTMYEQKGKVETFSGMINSNTGSFNVRAGFMNPGMLLRSGHSGKVRIPTPVKDVLLIPQSASYELQGKRFVYKLGQKNTVIATEISVREVPGGQLFVVDSGISVGDVIALEGIPLLSDGMSVIPKKVSFQEVLKSTESADQVKN